MKQDDIGKFILELREERGWTQEELGDRVPVTRQAVSRWEQGKSIPDSSTLLILSNIFDVSINELLSGKRIPKKDMKLESEKIALEMVDKNISNQNKIKKILIIFICSVVTFVVGFLGYYFFATYDSVKVYSIGGISDKFYLKDGLMIVTKQKIYFKLSRLESYDDLEIEKVKLYFEKNGKEKLLFEDADVDILIKENYGYEEHFYYEDLEDILKGLKLEIYYGGEVEELFLDVFLSLSNNKFTFNKKEDDIVVDNDNALSEKEMKIINFMKTNGTYENECYTYKVDNKVFRYFDCNNKLSLERNSSIVTECWEYKINTKKMYYSLYDGNNVTYSDYNCSDSICDSDEIKNINRFNNYINKYILSKSN